MTPVSSSNIESVGYDPQTQELAVLFAHGKTYVYRGVPPDVAEMFVNSESAGKFFAANIKGQYPNDPPF